MFLLIFFQYRISLLPLFACHKWRRNIVFENTQKVIGECLKTMKKIEKEKMKINEKINQPCKMYHFAFLLYKSESWRSIDKVELWWFKGNCFVSLFWVIVMKVSLSRIVVVRSSQHDFVARENIVRILQKIKEITKLWKIDIFRNLGCIEFWVFRTSYQFSMIFSYLVCTEYWIYRISCQFSILACTEYYVELFTISLFFFVLIVKAFYSIIPNFFTTKFPTFKASATPLSHSTSIFSISLQTDNNIVFPNRCQDKITVITFCFPSLD